MKQGLSVEVLRIRDFRLTLLTRLLVMTAWVAQDVIIGWQVYSLTRSPFILGLTGLAEAIPALVCALFAGHIVDISRPYVVNLICLATLVANALMLLLIAGGIITAPGNVLFWLFAGIFISGLPRSFLMAASFALLPRIVPRPQIPAASAWLTSGFQLATITGPAIAGIIYGGYGPRTAWFLPVALMASAFCMLLGLSEAPRQWRSSEKREPAAQSIKAGWKFILTNRLLLSVMALDMFAVLFGGAVAMLPAFADQVLHVGSQGLGALRAAPAVGAIVMALFLAVKPFKRIPASLLLVMVIGFGLCMIGFGFSTNFWLSMLFLAASGAFDSVSMVIRQTLMQWLTPDTMRGRVSSVNSMFVISSNEIGAFESGVAAKLLGLMPSVIFGGFCTLLVVAATALLSPKLLKITVDADNNGSPGKQ